jgi:hypothetical protein
MGYAPGPLRHGAASGGRRSLVTSRAWYCCAASALALGAAGCHSSDAGVRAVVRVDLTQWDDQHPFDHVTVTAEGGGKRAAACLFPANEIPQQRVLEASDTSCADLHTAPWTAPPVIDAWNLSESPRTIDFVFPQGDDLDLTAVAAFGGSAMVGSANAEATADSSYPDVILSLTPGDEPIPPSCPLTLENAIPPFVAVQSSLCFGAAACPALPGEEQCLSTAGGGGGGAGGGGAGGGAGTGGGTVGTQCFSHSAGVTCNGTGSRIANLPGATCSADPTLVYRGWTDANAPPTVDPLGFTCQARVFVTGRFARCAAPGSGGTCAVTTSCTPPSTSVGVLLDKNLSFFMGSQDIACLPPYPVLMTFSFLLQLPMHDWELGLTQDPVSAAASDACFFDVQSFDVQPEGASCPYPPNAMP